MKLSVFFTCLFAPMFAYAGGVSEPCGPQLPKHIAIKRNIKRPQIITKTVTVQAPVTPQVQTQSLNGTNTNTQTIVINIAQPTPRYNLGTGTVHTLYRPNRLMLLGGLAKTNGSVITDDCGCSASLQMKREFDIGAMYLRDLGRVTVGAAYTLRHSAFLAVGFNW